jgi:hypothetical protein
MQVSRAASIWLEYHRSHSRETILKAYQASSGIFLGEFADRQIGEISREGIPSFLNEVTEGKSPKPDESDMPPSPRPRGTSARSPTLKQSGGLTTSTSESVKGEAPKASPKTCLYHVNLSGS